MKTIRSAAEFFFLFIIFFSLPVLGVGENGNVCVWIGQGGDGKWSTAANWQNGVKPTNGNGDEVWLSAANGSNITNDIPASPHFALDCIRFTGSSRVYFSSDAQLYLGAAVNPWSNACPVTSWADIRISSYSEKTRIWASKPVEFNGDLICTGTYRIGVYTHTDTEAVITINGDIRTSCAVSFDSSAASSANPGIIVNGRTVVKEVMGTTEGQRGRFTKFNKPISCSNMNLCFHSIMCGAENVLCPTSSIVWTGYYQAGLLDLNGFNQTCDRLGGVFIYNKNIPRESDRTIESEKDATLTIRATSSSNTYAIVKGRASICYAPVDSSFVQTFSIRTNNTFGALVVSNGTLRLAAGSKWQNLSGIDIWPTGVLEIDSANGVADPFPARPAVRIATGGKLKIPSGVAFSSSSLLVGLSPAQSGRTYSGVAGTGVDETVDWIEGAGKLTVAGNGGSAAMWATSSGSWTSPSSWMDGVLPSATVPAFVQTYGRDVTVRVDAASPVSTNLVAESVLGGGGGTVSFDVTALWPFSRAWIAFGKDVSVTIGDGGTFRYDGSSTLAKDKVDDDRIAVRDGAVFTVESGGTVSVTNLQGRFVVGGGSEASTGTLNVEAGGAFNLSAGHDGALLAVEKGGRIVSEGALRIYRANHQYAEHLAMSGGSITVAGDGFLELPSTNAFTGGILRFGTGTTVFKDCARFQVLQPANYQSAVVVSPTEDGDTAEVTFEGSSYVTNSVFNLYVGNFQRNFKNGVSRLTMKKGATWKYGVVSTGATAVNEYYSANKVSVGHRVGKGVLDLRGDEFRFGMYGLNVAFSESKSSSDSAEGEVVVSEGCTASLNSWASYNRSSNSGATKPLSRFMGCMVGLWLNTTADAAPRAMNGSFTLKDERTTFTILGGHLVMGAGKAEGAFTMSGDSLDICLDDSARQNGNTDASGNSFYEYATNAVMAVGMLTGKGTFTQTRGRVRDNLRTYVGGCETNMYFDGAYIPTWSGLVGQRSSEGLLRVSGGSFEATKEVYVGIDGSGTIEVGPAGRFSARTLVLSNRTESVLRLVFGADGFTGGVEVTNLVIAAGARLEVDLAGYCRRRARWPLIRAVAVEGDFAEEDITISGDMAPYATVERSGGTWSVFVPRGTAFMFR